MQESADPAPRTALPLACTLEPADGPARLRRWQRLGEAAAPVASLRGGQLEVHYAPGPGVLAELADLAAAEQTCCSFVAWSAAEVDGHPVLQVTAPDGAPHAVAPIAAMFGVSAPAAAAPQETIVQGTHAGRRQVRR